MSGETDVLVAAVRRTRNQYGGFMLFVTLLGVGMVLGGAAGVDQKMITRVMCALFGALFTVVGLGLGYMAFTMRDPEFAPVTLLVKQRPEEVAWIYVQQVDSQAAGVSVRKTHHVRVASVFGKTYNIAVANAQLQPLLTMLSAAAPRAAGGYSKELERQYKQDPRSVMNQG